MGAFKGDLHAMRRAAARTRLAWRAAGFAFAFVIPAVIVWNAPSDPRPWWYYASIAWISLNVVLSVVRWVARRFRPREKSAWEKGWVLWSKMCGMYNGLPRDAVVSPTQVRKELDQLSEAGAVWPGPAYAIIDHAIQRNPAVWVLSPQ